MAGRAECCRYEPSLDDLLDDAVMEPVLRSAGCNPQGLRDMMVATARRIDAHQTDAQPIDGRRIDRRTTRDDDRGNR